MPSKRKCKHCGRYGYDLIRVNAGSFCNMDHAIAWAKDKASRDKQKERDKKHRERKKRFNDNDRSLRTKMAQKAFNDFVRARDANLPCVSCDRFHDGQYHAGHYRTVGAHPDLRFEEANCHKQCSVCNNHKSGNIADYRIELVKRIGVEKVEWLEGPHEAKKYTCEELKEIELKYKHKLKELRGE